MGGDSRKWIVLVATTWIQAFAGTNLDFSSYSSHFKSILGISQVQLNYISVASDMGKAFGWCSGIALRHFPTWIVVLVAALMGLLGYGLQWLAIREIISLPYFLVLVLSLLAGCSICWLNTACYVLCIEHFPGNRGLALSLGVSYSGMSAALYNLIANSIDHNDTTLYLLLNAIVPLMTSAIALFLITLSLPSEALPPSEEPHPRDYAIFLFITAVATITGLHLLLNSKSSNPSVAHKALLGAVFLLVLPLLTPGMICVWAMAKKVIDSKFPMHGPAFRLIDDDEDHERIEELTEMKTSSRRDSFDTCLSRDNFHKNWLHKNEKTVELGEEHSASLLIRRLDFWLYYVAYFCGGTIGLVYSNNIGQISESLSFSKHTSSLVALYSASSFFGRLLSTVPDFLQDKVSLVRTVWLTAAIVPTPAAFLLLVLSPSEVALDTASVLIGLSSGFVFSTAVAVTSDLFGPNSAGVNHNILITNVPIGSLVYSLLAALVYEDNMENSSTNSSRVILQHRSAVCTGQNCYHKTFVWWWLISLLGLVSSILLSLRTKATYSQLRKQKHKSIGMSMRT